ncbi:hypothetical protein C4J81_10020 [Deltaproteobacteria bacterium Smac51]|nr:hypothetical protein C4J81_10020 [Deltaproteobacteria bacterium Smac51]
MKKALAMALGAALVAGSAVPASAASMVDFSGFYRAIYSVNGNLGFTGDDNLNDNFFENRLQINVRFQATDEVSVHWRVRTPSGQRWGDRDTNRTLDNRYYYGQVVQDWGTIRVGRLNGGQDEFGLSTLGYAPALDAEMTYIAPFEGSAEYDSIQYTNTWENGFGLKTSYSKVNTDWRPQAEIDHRSGDHDYDRFQIEGFYLWDGGGASLNVMYERDATADPLPNAMDDDGFGVEDTYSAWFINPAIMHSWGAFSVHFEGKVGWGETKFTRDADRRKRDADAEGQGFYLDFDYNYGPGRVNLAGWWVSGTDLGDRDNKGIVDIVDGNFYPLVAAYGAVNAYGGGPVKDGRRHTYGAVGVANSNTFVNYEVLSSNVVDARFGVGGMQQDLAGILDGRDYADIIGTPDQAIYDAALARDTVWDSFFNGVTGIDVTRTSRVAFDNGNANHWALMLSGQHGFTDEITFNWALAYLSLTNPNFRTVKGGSFNPGTGAWGERSYYTQDKELGFEIDLGVNIQLLDNLAFTSTFGYLFAGDAYKQIKGYNVNQAANGDYNVNAKFEDSDDVYTWVNTLSFSF